MKNESEIFLLDENNNIIESKYYNDANFENLRVYVNTTYEPNGKEIQKAVYTNPNKIIKSVISIYYDKNMQLIIQKQYKHFRILAKIRFFLTR